MRNSILLPAALLVGLSSLIGCNVPDHMHVTEGTAPQNVDTDVRFRTTYYFRVFDYCWAANTTLGSAADGGVAYRKIIPETDTLYRYRMTGKSSALFNEIKFESGILKKEQIDPFGTDVVYNSDIGGFLVRDEAEANAEAEAIADARAREVGSAAALQRFEILHKIYQELPNPDAGTPEAAEVIKIKEKLIEAIDQSLAVYTGNPSAQLPEKLSDQVGELTAALTELTEQLAAGTPVDAETSKRLTSLEDSVKSLTNLASNNKPFDTLCPPGAVRQKGFQVMGPEGMKEFDQSERLIMAMYTSAKPLTETLQEYSGRILNARTNPAEQLLPLVRENLRIVEARNAAERIDVEVTEREDAAPAADAVFNAALDAFDGR